MPRARGITINETCEMAWVFLFYSKTIQREYCLLNKLRNMIIIGSLKLMLHKLDRLLVNLYLLEVSPKNLLLRKEQK